MVDYDKYFKSYAEEDYASYYDEVDILELSYHAATQPFTYPCPCGDLFIISLGDMENGETVARCPSCSLVVLVDYDRKDLDKYSTMGAGVGQLAC